MAGDTQKNPWLLRPWRRVARVELLDPQELLADGIRFVMLDRDNTVVPRDAKEPPASVLAWIDSLHEVGIATYMVSNNSDAAGVARSAEAIHCKGISFACKPLPFALLRVLRSEGIKRSEAVMVGDQLFTDGLAGSLAGVRSILVLPQCKTEPWFTAISRAMERPFLRNVPVEGAE